MLKEERHNLILEEIKTNNKAYSSSLSKKLDVSEDTIRRDLNDLAENGHIKKVHGGAMANPYIPEGIKIQSITKQNERTIIAKKCLPLIQNDQVLLFDGDTTNLILIDMLPHDLRTTIFTNSIQMAGKLFDYPNIETVLLGGKLSHKQRITVGLEVINALSDIHADILFLEISSLHTDLGITSDDRENALTKKAMIRSTSKVVAQTLSCDIGSIQPFKVEPAEKISTIVTELENDNLALASLQNKGIDII